MPTSPKVFPTTIARNAASDRGPSPAWSRLAAVAGALGLAALSAGCDTYAGARTVVVQGKYDPKTCEELAQLHMAYSRVIDDHVALQRKAEREPGGFVIGAAVYGTTLASVRGDRQLVEETQREKNCPPPPEAAPTPPASKPKQPAKRAG